MPLLRATIFFSDNLQTQEQKSPQTPKHMPDFSQTSTSFLGQISTPYKPIL
jgi:hypothetical protein